MCWKRSVEVRKRPRPPPTYSPHVVSSYNSTNNSTTPLPGTMCEAGEVECKNNTIGCVVDNGVCCYDKNVGSQYCKCKSEWEGEHCQKQVDDYDLGDFELVGNNKAAQDVLIGSLFVAGIITIIIVVIAVWFGLRMYRKKHPRDRPSKTSEEGQGTELDLLSPKNGPNPSNSLADRPPFDADEVIASATMVEDENELNDQTPKGPGRSWTNGREGSKKGDQFRSVPSILQTVDLNSNEQRT